jgi:hypothetical protein
MKQNAKKNYPKNFMRPPCFFDRACPLSDQVLAPYSLHMTLVSSPPQSSEILAPISSPSPHDEILKTLQLYIDGSKQGNSQVMSPAFHPQASFFGYAGDQLAIGTAFLFDWIDRNGPAPDIEPRVVSVDILGSIAVVRLEVANWSGKLAGSGVRMSDLFTFLRMPEGWKIIQKAFHWHS